MSEQIPPIGESATSWLCDRLADLQIIRDECDPSKTPCYFDWDLPKVIDDFVQAAGSPPADSGNAAHGFAKALVKNARRVLESYRRFDRVDELGSLARLALFQRLPDADLMKTALSLRQEAAMLAAERHSPTTEIGPYTGKVRDGALYVQVDDEGRGDDENADRRSKGRKRRFPPKIEREFVAFVENGIGNGMTYPAITEKWNQSKHKEHHFHNSDNLRSHFHAAKNRLEPS